ncbi:MAG: hypothetical protein ACRC42_04630 [Mycoplasma sp.]
MEKVNRTVKFKEIINNMTKKKKIIHASFFIFTLISLALCIWAAIAVTIEKTNQLDLLNSYAINDQAKLDALFAAHGMGWKEKGLDAFSWYLTSLDAFGGAVYWISAIFGFISAPLIIYYISATLIIFFPKKKKVKKEKVKEVENVSK